MSTQEVSTAQAKSEEVDQAKLALYKSEDVTAMNNTFKQIHHMARIKSHLSDDECNVAEKITRRTFLIMAEVMKIYIASGKATDEDKESNLNRLINYKEFTEEHDRIIKQDANRKIRNKERRERVKLAKQKAENKTEDGEEITSDQVKAKAPKKKKTPAPKKEKKPPVKKETVLMKRARDWWKSQQFEFLAACLHMGEVGEELEDLVMAKIDQAAPEDREDPHTCFTCGGVYAKTYSTDCCLSSVRFCERCMVLFTKQYMERNDVGRRDKNGVFSCYKCKAQFTFPSAQNSPSDAMDYTQMKNPFFALFWYNVLNDNKVGPMLTTQPEVIKDIAAWVIKTLEDELSPNSKLFLNQVSEFSTANKETISKCVLAKQDGKNIEEFLREEKDKKMKRSKRKVNPSEDKPKKGRGGKTKKASIDTDDLDELEDGKESCDKDMFEEDLADKEDDVNEQRDAEEEAKAKEDDESAKDDDNDDDSFIDDMEESIEDDLKRIREEVDYDEMTPSDFEDTHAEDGESGNLSVPEPEPEPEPEPKMPTPPPKPRLPIAVGGKLNDVVLKRKRVFSSDEDEELIPVPSPKRKRPVLSSDSDDDEFVEKPKVKKLTPAKKRRVPVKNHTLSDSEDDEPVVQTVKRSGKKSPPSSPGKTVLPAVAETIDMLLNLNKNSGAVVSEDDLPEVFDEF
uniref:ORF23 n=1 Tax=Malaco herpesvirus 1 TaxID=3031797 RepID=A0AA48P920_9VIRU|nr:TPA_asm: ORF23 [Malaco herpesvirus 1]